MCLINQQVSDVRYALCSPKHSKSCSAPVGYRRTQMGHIVHPVGLSRYVLNIGAYASNYDHIIRRVPLLRRFLPGCSVVILVNCSHLVGDCRSQLPSAELSLSLCIFLWTFASPQPSYIELLFSVCLLNDLHSRHLDGGMQGPPAGYTTAKKDTERMPGKRFASLNSLSPTDVEHDKENQLNGKLLDAF